MRFTPAISHVWCADAYRVCTEWDCDRAHNGCKKYTQLRQVRYGIVHLYLVPSNPDPALKLNTSPLPGGAGLDNNATIPGCKSNWGVDHGTPSEFGESRPLNVSSAIKTLAEAFGAECDDESTILSNFRRVVFWFYTSQPSPLVTAIFCHPQIELWNVTATLDLATAKVISVVPMQKRTDVASIMQTPLNGRPYNGIEAAGNFSTDYFTVSRQNATKLQLPAAVLQAASVNGVYNPDRFTALTDKVYVSASRQL